MSRICIAKDNRHFIKDDKPFFLMADTAWSSFTNPTMSEWLEYISLRKRQGFNSLLINILPQWDRGLASGEKACPFSAKDHCTWEFEALPPAYFEHACSMLAEMKKLNMTPVLVLLWANYTKGTFFDKLWGHSPMAASSVEKYVRYAADLFRRYDPIYFISGDTNFPDETVDDYYLPALKALKDVDPQALASLHICGTGFNTPEIIEESIPARLLYNTNLDFYTYQSGHYAFFEERCYECAQAFSHLRVTKPVINAEPCYEGWDTQTGAYSRKEMRRTAYLSVLNGASAGLCHGTQGVWQWYRKGDFFAPSSINNQPKLYDCLEPFLAKDAIYFEGASDRSFVAQVVNKHKLYTLQPCTVYEARNSNYAMAQTSDENAFILYIPRNQRILVKFMPDDYCFTLYCLESRQSICPQILPQTDGFILESTGINSDLLLVGEKPRQSMTL